MPGLTPPSWAVAVTIPGRSAEETARTLRKLLTPIYGRIERDRLLLDLRTVDRDEEEHIVATFCPGG